MIGPYDRYPPSADARYVPPEAPLSRYFEVAQRLGIERAVLVHPSFYGDDPQRVIDALEECAGYFAAVGIGPAPSTMTPSMAVAWAERGIRGVRVNQHHGTERLENVVSYAAALVDEGMHLQVYPQSTRLGELEAVLQRTGLDIVVDHLGDIDPRLPLGEGGGLETLDRLLDTGRVWVKVVPYLVSRDAPECRDTDALVVHLSTNHPERVLWGSNWPHPVPGLVPQGADVALTRLGLIVQDRSALHSLMWSNAEAFYRFPSI